MDDEAVLLKERQTKYLAKRSLVNRIQYYSYVDSYEILVVLFGYRLNLSD